MFAGIGGFRSGLERLGGYECVGYCEIDKYAKQAYDARLTFSTMTFRFGSGWSNSSCIRFNALVEFASSGR